MSLTKLKQMFSAVMIATLLLSTATVIHAPAALAAPAAQEVRAQEVSGVLTGGQFDKIWLGLAPETKGQNITIISEWDRESPEAKGLGFYVLDEGGLNRVLNGSSNVHDANLAVGGKLSPQTPANQLGAVISATGDSYTIVLFNDSSTDASFTLKVTNGFVVDDSDQVRDLKATPAPAGDEDTADAEATETPEPAETPAPAATTATTATTTTTATTATATATPVATPVAVGTPGVVRAEEMRGELLEKDAQHFLGLEPNERDGQMTLTLSYDPQDNSELARRLNFWVLDEAGFNRFRTGSTNVNPSQLALAAGSSDPNLPSNQRRAVFSASGMGPYTVIVYNNSSVPGYYTLQVKGGVLVDDSMQTVTAQQGLSATATLTGTVVATDTAAAATTAAATPAAGGREGTPGGAYVVQSGDTLSLIARDIYGDLSLWDEICAFNNLADCNVIEVGDTLNLPTQAQIGAGIAPSTTAAATPTPAATAKAVVTPTSALSSGALTSTATVTETEATTSTGTTTPTGTTTGTTGTGSTATVDLVAALEAQGSFNTLVQALEAANLTAALQGAGPFTIFAPTDAAFAALPVGAMDQLLANPTGQLTQILLFHVLPGEVTTADITNGMQATTQQGKPVSFEVTGGTVKVNGATVVVPDIAATNGVIQAIGAVILPPPD